MIKHRFQDEILGEAAEAIVNKVVFEELEGRGLKPLAPPKVEDVKLDEGQPLTFKAVFETLPIVELPDWQGLEAKVKGPRRQRRGRRQGDRPAARGRRALRPGRGGPAHAQHGDYVVVDLTWKPVDGGKGGHDENALIEIGNADNHEDMNKGLEGLSAGETKEIDVAWGQDAAPKIAGKTVRYTVTLKAIKDKVVPAADDDFAKDLGEFDSLGGAARQGPLAAPGAEDRRVDRDTKAALVEALVARAGFEVPEALVERHMTRAHRERGPRPGLPGHRPHARSG